ncbi:MAG: hypothetical protein V7K55_19525 [Nostoc sp.]
MPKIDERQFIELLLSIPVAIIAQLLRSLLLPSFIYVAVTG